MDDLLPTTVVGLPLHPLVVHATVVLVPLTALLVLLSAVVPRIRMWAGWLPVAMAAVCVVLVQLSTSSGATLQRSGRSGPLVAEHARLGELLVWWVLGLFLVTTAAYLLRRMRRDSATGVALGLAVAGVLVAGGTIVQTVLIGHSGAKAVWDGVISDSSAGARSVE